MQDPGCRTVVLQHPLGLLPGVAFIGRDGKEGLALPAVLP